MGPAVLHLPVETTMSGAMNYVNTRSDSFIFFTIFDNTTSSFVYDAGFLASTTAGLNLAAGTLAAGHSYSDELIFSNRDIVPSSGTTFDVQLGYDFRTTGTFDTLSVPEPAFIMMLGTSLTGFAAYLRKRRRPAGACCSSLRRDADEALDRLVDRSHPRRED